MEVLWRQVNTRRGKLLIDNEYRPPDAPTSWMDSLALMSEKVVQEKGEVALMGDLNCNMFNPDSQAVKLGMVTSEYGLSQVMDGPTRITQ